MSTWSDSPVASHTYDAPGTYSVVLTVRDDGDPALEDSFEGRVTVIEDDTGGGPVVRNYTFTPNIAYSCTVDFFGTTTTVVDFDFERFELTLDGTSAQVRVFSGDPGTMTGAYSAPSFNVTGFQDGGIGGCSETYNMTGTINPDESIDFTLTADYVGSICGTCSAQRWTGRVASPE